MATYLPIDLSAVQFYFNSAPASGYFLKAYAAGTTTPISLFTTKTGTGPLAKVQIDSQGFPINGSAARFTPYVAQDYKLALYPNAATADANTTAQAIFVIDYPGAVSGFNTITERSTVSTVQTVTQLTALDTALLTNGQYIQTLGRDVPGDGGHGIFKWDSASGLADDNFLVQQPNAGGVGRYLLQLESEISVKVAGAKGDGSTNDTAAIQKCIDAASLTSIVYFPTGSYVLQTTSTGVTWRNSTFIVCRALNINKSNLKIRGINARILLKGTDVGGVSEANFAFGTNKNLTAGTLANLSFTGLSFDFNPTGLSGLNYGSFYIVGADDVEFHDIFCYSGGARNSAYLDIENSFKVKFNNIRFSNISTCLQFWYTSQVQMDNIVFDYADFGIFGQVISEVNISNVMFTSTPQYGAKAGRFIDFSSCKNINISNIVINNATELGQMYFLASTQPNFSDYISSAAVSTFTITQDITLSNLKIKDTGTTSSILYLGKAFVTAVGELPKNITFKDITLENSGFFNVLSCDNLLIDGFSAKNCLGNATAGNAVLSLKRGSGTGYDLRATLKNIRIDTINASMQGIYATGFSQLIIDGCYVNNYPLSAIQIVAPAAKAKLSIRNLELARTVNTVVTGIGVDFLAFPANSGVHIDWDSTNRITQYTTPISVSNSATGDCLPCVKFPFGPVAVSGVSEEYVLYRDREKSAYFGGIYYSTQGGLAASGANFCTYNVYRGQSSTGTLICTRSDTGGVAAIGGYYDSNFVAPEVAALTTPTQNTELNQITLSIVATGTGRNLLGFQVDAHFVEFYTT